MHPGTAGGTRDRGRWSLESVVLDRPPWVQALLDLPGHAHHTRPPTHLSQNSDTAPASQPHFLPITLKCFLLQTPPLSIKIPSPWLVS